MPDSTVSTSEKSKRGWSWGRLLAWALAVLFFGFVMREVLYPFAGEKYVEFTHGSHSHYAPKDRNENVPISKFPTRRPDPGERITPDGKIVPRGE